MKRCMQCSGRFGLTRHRWYTAVFCSKRCREKYLDKLAKDRERLRQWFGLADRRSPAN